MGKIIIISPGKCAGSAIARTRDDIIYTHGPFFLGFTRTGRIIMRPLKRIRIFLFDVSLFFKIIFANKVILILRDERSWNEAMFWQDFPQIYLDALSLEVIGNKQDQGLLEDLFQFWLERRVWRSWIKYFSSAYFWFGLKKHDFVTLQAKKRILRGKVLLIDYDYCFSKAGKKFMLEETGINLDDVKRVNDSTRKWYADLRHNLRSQQKGH